MSTTDATRCCVCGRAFSRASKPSWASNPQNGHLIGITHRTCITVRKLNYVWTADVPAEGAQFEAWHDFTYHPHSDGYDFLAAILIGAQPPREEPDERQQELMAHWTSPGNSIGHEGAQAAWTRYRELCAEYAAWLIEQQ